MEHATGGSDRKLPADGADRSSCAAFEEMLVPYLDRELPEERSTDLEIHVAGCPACARILWLHRQVGEILDAHLSRRADRAGSSPEALPIAVRRRIRGAGIRRWAAAAAALLLGAALAGAWLWRTPPADEDLLIIRNLDILEEIHEEAGEVTLDFVRILLEGAEGTGGLDPAIFEELLEEELALERI
ncbi:MAG: zf-HC2 domain-containing protein [Planctomycetes bacterium]|nr:zf-HC2 domain-containing protein [Planctomycetota bacterium]